MSHDFDSKYSDDRKYESCPFCVWLQRMRDGKVSNLAESELEAWGAHLILQHEYKE